MPALDDQQKHAPPRARLLLWPREAGVRATGIGDYSRRWEPPRLNALYDR